VENNLFVLLHIKMYKSNFFCIVSNSSGKVIFTKNSGTIGFSNIQKRSVQALISILEIALKEILLLKKTYIFLKLEGFKINALKDVYKHLIISLKKNHIGVLGVKRCYKIAHSGCRVKK
jgi:ribosomal protein S11